MNKIKNSVIIAAYVLLVTIFFFGGYAFGSREGEKELVFDAPEPTVQAAVQAAAVKETDEEEKIFYTVIIQNGRLCLFKDDGGSRTLVSSDEISENIYPSADIAELRKGIEFDSMEKAQELFENFVS